MFGTLKRALVGPSRLPTPTRVASHGHIVLGMHRSGTSCLTGLLETSGLWLGEDSHRNAGKGNLEGSLESHSVR